MALANKLRIELLEDRRVLSAGPVISEFMASNSTTLLDGDGNSSDWIEIHNPTAAMVDLTGWHLTDIAGDPTKWTFPAASLAPDEYLVVFASSPGVDNYVDAGGFLHTNFGLALGGEYVALTDSLGNVAHEYGLEFPPQSADVSYGLDQQQLAVYFEHPTPGAANDFSSAYSVQVIVSEIMYHPSSSNDLEEYVELYNGEPNAIALMGWSLAGAVDFQLPAIVLNPGQYLVVAADPTALAGKYGDGVNVVGPWQGRLANGGEEIRLHDALGRQVDVVTYSDEGDWADREQGPLDRGHRGWVWSDAHDGGGSSLELVSFGVSNQWGHNWSASTAAEGTPGAENSVADVDSDVAPLIVDVTHLPVIPNSTDDVVVSAKLIDELTSDVGATLFWRIDGAPDFTLLSMSDDGNGGDATANDQTFAATLPPLPNETVVEFYVESSDQNGNTRTYPAPTLPDDEQLTNLLYQVDDEFDPNSLPGPDDMSIYRLIMTEAERAELEQIGLDRPEAWTHARMNGTLVSVREQGVEARYLVGIRNRGAGSADRQPNSYHVDIPHDDPWQGIEAFNLNTQNTHLQLAGLQLYQAAGFVAEDTAPVQVRVNGVNLSDAGPPSFGVYVELESTDSVFVANHFPDDADGNLYRIRSDSGRRWGDLRDLGSDPADYAYYVKQTNAAEADYSDVIELVDVLNNSPDEAYYQRVSQVVDIDQWLGYFATLAILATEETSLATGSGDDYLLYRGVSDPRFLLIPHDMDTILGQGDAMGSPTSGIYEAAAIPTVERFLTHPNIAPAYHETLKSLLETTFSKASFDPLLDDLLTSFTPPERIADMKSFMDDRREFILDLVSEPITAAASLPTAGGFYRTDQDSVALVGTAPLAGTRSVFVNGAPAELDPASGEWFMGNSTGGEIEQLIASGDQWQYLDAGRTPSTAPGNDWRVDDPGWSDAGPSQLGYGDGDEQQEVEFIDVDPDQAGTQKNISTYFRKTFDVAGADDVVSLTLRIVRDDGAVIFLNGDEVARPNMPDGPIDPDTPAASNVSGSEEDEFFEIDVDPDLLVEGENVIAVEVHQDDDGSSDISFDLELTAVVGDPMTLAGVELTPGINRLAVEAFDDDAGAGNVIDETFVDVWYNAGVETILAGPITTDQTLTAAGGPYVVQSDLVVSSGVLTIEPGVTVFFNPDAALIVQDGGRIVAEGTADARIRLTHNPNLGAGQWDGLSLVDTPHDNRLTYIDMQSGDGAGQAVFIDSSTVLFDQAEWFGIEDQVLDLVHPSLEVRNSIIPGISGDETIHLSGLDQGESLLFDGNVIGFNSSGGDVVDLGHDTLTPPTIVFRNNVFLGGLDDGIDTDGFPVLIENNVFQNFHNGTTRTTTSNAVSTGRSDVDGQIVSSDLTLRGNTFFDNDHDLLLKDFSQAVLISNTLVGATIGSVHFTEDNGNNVIGPGLGATLDGNIFWDAATALLDVQPETLLTVNRSTVPAEFFGFGVGNIDQDPLLVDPAGGDFSLQRESPAIGAGPNGTDMGAVQTPRFEPASAANLRVTELHYHPLAGDRTSGEIGADAELFEFIELRNVGAETIDLTDVALTDGVDFVFPWQASLDAGEYTVLVNSGDVFQSRYGDNAALRSEYAGKLANNGENITLLAADGSVIQQFAYNDSAGWPQAADGAGPSLVVVDTSGDYDAASNYRNSTAIGGSPGRHDETTLTADFDSNAQVDGFDFLLWQRGIGIAAPNATLVDGDADADRDVDQADLQLLEASFGAEAFAAPAIGALSVAVQSASAAKQLNNVAVATEHETVAEVVNATTVDAAILTELTRLAATRPTISPIRSADNDLAAYDAAIETSDWQVSAGMGRRSLLDASQIDAQIGAASWVTSRASGDDSNPDEKQIEGAIDQLLADARLND